MYSLHNFPLCEGCIVGKQHKTPFSKSNNSRTKVALELIHFTFVVPCKQNLSKASILCERDRIDNSKPKYDYVFSLKWGVKDRDLLKYSLNRHTLS
jgi:hypothetical protein